MATSASASTKWPASLLIDVAGPSLTAEASGGLLALLAGVFPGSGSAWLGPSQKGDLPKFRRATPVLWMEQRRERLRPHIEPLFPI